MPWVGFESTIPVFKRAKTVQASDRAVTVINSHSHHTDWTLQLFIITLISWYTRSSTLHDFCDWWNVNKSFLICFWISKEYPISSNASVVYWSELLATGPGFDSRRYQIFWEVVGLERGPLSLVRITEELLEWKSSGSGSRKPRLMAVGIRCAGHATLYPQRLALTSPTCGRRSVGIVRLRPKATEFSFYPISSTLGKGASSL
jgi:hypothetical protein